MFIKYIDKEADKTILTNEFGNKKRNKRKTRGLISSKMDIYVIYNIIEWIYTMLLYEKQYL